MYMAKKGYTYIITNLYNTVLYIGVTSDLIARIYQHKNKIFEGFSKRYNLTKLVYYEMFDTIEEAIEREKFIKKRTRKYKNSLIDSINNKWIDLYDEIISK